MHGRLMSGYDTTARQMGDITNHFSYWEFACRCGCGEERIDIGFVNDLQQVRSLHGEAFIIVSGCRCPSHNAAEGGSKVSAHLVKDLGTGPFSHAADIYCPTSLDRAELLPLLWSRFDRVGIGRDFLHVDIDLSLPFPRIFDYYGD